MKLCKKTGRRLRGVYVACVYTDLSSWGIHHNFDVPFFTTRDIHIKAMRLLNTTEYPKPMRNLAISVYDLIPGNDEQLELFFSPVGVVSEAMDDINDKWGEFVVTPALMMGMEGIILDRVSFGGVKELQEVYLELLHASYNKISFKKLRFSGLDKPRVPLDWNEPQRTLPLRPGGE